MKQIFNCSFLLWLLLVLSPAAYGQDAESLLLSIEDQPCAANVTAIHQTIKSLLKQAPNPDDELRLLRQIGSWKYCEGDIDSTIYYYQRALKLGLQHRLDSQNCQLYNRLGFYFQSKGELDSSLHYLQLSKALSEQTGNQLYIGASEIGIGTIHQHKGDIDRSMEAYIHALELAERLGDRRLEIGAKLNIATIYYDHYPEKLQSIDFLELLRISREIQDIAREMSVLEWLGYLAADSARYVEAVAYFNEGLGVNQQAKDSNQEVLFLQGLAYVYDLSGDNKKSIETNNQIISYVMQSGYALYLPSMYVSNASNYLALQDYANVIAEGDKAIKAGVATGQKELYYKVLGYMASAYEHLGLYKQAYQTQADYMVLTNEMFNEQKSKQIAEVETKYETAKKESEIESLSQRAQIQELQLQNQQYGLVALAILIVLLAGGAFLLHRQRNLKAQQRITNMELDEARKRLTVEKQFRESELKALRSQMNPHFVFNALNSIQEYIMLNEKRLAGKYLGKFADLMRTYLDHSQRKAVSVQEEADALVLYLELEKLRFEDSLSFTVLTDPELDADEVKLPALLVQPFVENAIKHGLLHKRGERKLEVSFRQEGDFLLCTVADNGVGRKASAAINKNRSASHKSFATGAIQERIALINYSLQLPVQAETIDLVDDAGQGIGTRVTIRIPVDAFSTTLV